MSQNQYISYNDAYGQNNPVDPMSMGEIDNMRKRIYDNISDLNGNKQRLPADTYHQLLNYHHYSLTILDNLKTIKQAEMSDPYNSNIGLVKRTYTGIETINPFGKRLEAVYKRDGHVVIVDKDHNKNPFKGEWEQQFDEGVINPPCYTIPPSNLWGLPQ
jgi:hypothetical protein